MLSQVHQIQNPKRCAECIAGRAQRNAASQFLRDLAYRLCLPRSVADRILNQSDAVILIIRLYRAQRQLIMLLSVGDEPSIIPY